MRYAIAVFLLVGISLSLVPAKDGGNPAQAEEPIDPALLRLRDKLNPELTPWSPDHVVERCAEHLATINTGDRERIRYLSLHAVPRQLLPAATSALFFTCNSAARIPITQRPRVVPNTDNRLYWIDLAWFNWSPESWEKISTRDPYFREPIVASRSTGLYYLRESTKANPVLDAGWFIFYVMDNGEALDLDNGQTFNENAPYYQLLYSNVEFERNGKKVRGVGPKNVTEFEAAWKVNFDVLKEFPIDKGAMVDHGLSGVAWNDRIVWRVRTAIGSYWRTFDVFRTQEDQDFIETPFPKKFNGGEHIVQDDRGAQFYLLTDGKGNSVDFANPFLVKGDPTSAHNTVLVTSRSCIHCHDTGILDFRNEHLKMRDAGADLRAIDYARAERFNQFFLQEAKMKRLVRDDQSNYSEFIRDAVGLTPQQSMQNFARVRNWYGGGVTLAQGARELGVSAIELELALAVGVGTIDKPQGATKGRLGRLALDGTPIPRHAWEKTGYSEAGLLLMEWVKRGKIGLGQDGTARTDRSHK